jgi:hypothetical protein
MNDPQKLMQEQGFWVVLVAGMFLGLLVFSSVALRKK